MSVVVAAHDEEASIGHLVRRLHTEGDPNATRIEVVVVANGCSDRTVEVARAASPAAKVIELEDASKSRALAAGDEVATAYPRFYVDADSDLDSVGLLALAAALDGRTVAVSPTVRHDARGCDLVVRSYYRFWTALPAAASGLAGAGAIGLTREARGRFVQWPDYLADDLFCDRQFAQAEKRRVGEVVTRVPAARSARALVWRKARVRNGNLQVERGGAGSASGGNAESLPDVLWARPALLVHLPAYLGVTAAARVLAAVDRRRGRADVWRRDDARGAGTPLAGGAANGGR